MSTFVSVGNAYQPFTRLLQAVASIADRLPQPVIVQHGHTSFNCAGCQPIPFLEMAAFEQAVASAEALILHAGAGSAIHAMRAGKIPIIMPRRREFKEHVDDHQVEFARALAATGRAVFVDDAAELEAGVAHARSLQASAIRAQPALAAMIARALADCETACDAK